MFEEIIGQLIFSILFLFISILIFTLPGLFLLDLLKIKDLTKLELYVVTTVLGLVLFTLTGYLLLIEQVSILVWFFPILGSFKLFSALLWKQKVKLNRKLHIDWVIFSVLIIGVIFQLAVIAPSGLHYQGGYNFWSAHGHDGLWHIALIEEIKKNIYPIQNPEYAGYSIQNYHFFIDLLMADVSYIFPLSSLDIYFRFVPLLLSVLLGLASYIFVKLFSGQKQAGIWAMIFTYFAGSFGYILTLLRDHNLNGETIFWISQPHSVIGNPPQMAAFVIVVTLLFCLLKFLNSSSRRYLVVILFLAGSVIEFKIYAGILVLIGLLVLSFWKLIKEKNILFGLFSLVVLIFSILIYFPSSNKSQDFLIFQPWWFIRTMVVSPDRLNLIDLELRRQTYLSEGNIKRVIELEIIAFFIYLIGNLGTRVLGFLTLVSLFKQKKLVTNFNIFFLSMTTAAFILPLIFLQKGVAYNDIQFSQYFLLFFGYLSAIELTNLLRIFKRLWPKITISALIIVLAIPTQIGLLMQFYQNPALARVRDEEVRALNYLSSISKTDSIILTGDSNKSDSKFFNPPLPIFAWDDTGYVSAFSKRRTLVSDREQLEIMGYNVDTIFEERNSIILTSSGDSNSQQVSVVNNFLVSKKIDYVYLVGSQHFTVPVEKVNVDLIFQSSDIRLYKVRT